MTAPGRRGAFPTHPPPTPANSETRPRHASPTALIRHGKMVQGRGVMFPSPRSISFSEAKTETERLRAGSHDTQILDFPDIGRVHGHVRRSSHVLLWTSHEASRSVMGCCFTSVEATACMSRASDLSRTMSGSMDGCDGMGWIAKNGPGPSAGSFMIRRLDKLVAWG